ncbi:hypothetical protein RclHR1_04190005 [Rhizophagus clarus]|uniref:Uncharacterized protein LOC114306727 n=1 Tax=Rhizophagus clarus TaxID=94130 RepID=A0A2Z6RHF6_9GLOM|nr:hypothetical protein RclHR1_04190005 [Rhizophagus clarus]GET04344.1 uncharacterized protein LOC114306727 [Rhizophagus clarus]
MVGDGHEVETSNRDIVLNLCDRTLQRISELHPSYDLLLYVLLFLNGDDGWHLNIPLILEKNTKRKTVTPMQFYSYRLQIRHGSWLHCAGRLNYLKLNQSTLRLELYKGVADAIHVGDNNTNIGHRIILPSSFVGDPRQM